MDKENDGMAFVAGTPEVSTAINLKNDFQTDKDAEYFRNTIREILRIFVRPERRPSSGNAAR